MPDYEPVIDGEVWPDLGPICPACGNPIDYCQGHGQTGDPIGRHTIYLHDNSNHTKCHPNSDCKEA